MKTFEFTEQEAELLRKEQYKYLINDNIDHFLLLVQQIISERITPEPGESGQSAEAYVKCTCTNGLEYSNCAKNCGHGQEPEPGQSAEDESQADYIKFMWDNGIGYGSFVTLDEYRHCMKTIKDYASQVCADKDARIKELEGLLSSDSVYGLFRFAYKSPESAQVYEISKKLRELKTK